MGQHAADRPDGRRVRRRRTVRPTNWVHLPFALVLAVAALGLLRIVQYHWREGSTLIGMALLLAAALRAVLSAERAGLIAVRSKGVDLLCYGGLGVLVIAVSLTIVGGPFS